MVTLLLDSSTEKGLVAFVNKGTSLFEQRLLIQGKNATTLLTGAITEGLNSLKIVINDLECVACATGPGFFSGVRAAVAFAQGVALGLKIPLISFSSLLGFIPQSIGPFAAVIDARLGGAYFLTEETPVPAFATYALLKEKLQCPIFGPTQGKLPFTIAEVFPNSAHLAAMVEQKRQKQEFSTAGQVDMIYLRPYV